ncbi:hypothetical protein NE237_008416 [Protea cynaroides]|uniref:Uncharacterized protein n=1 Tax=Protea cynaroides TaxID=273540 RepID=A0A9Q0KVU1_9MAGN|nr:hypothetical protein NE237_008416 [Protea cynaroides]
MSLPCNFLQHKWHELRKSSVGNAGIFCMAGPSPTPTLAGGDSQRTLLVHRLLNSSKAPSSFLDRGRSRDVAVDFEEPPPPPAPTWTDDDGNRNRAVVAKIEAANEEFRPNFAVSRSVGFFQSTEDMANVFPNQRHCKA